MTIKFLKRFILNRFMSKVKKEFPQYADLQSLTLIISKLPDGKQVGKMFCMFSSIGKKDADLSEKEISELKKVVPLQMSKQYGETKTVLLELNYAENSITVQITNEKDETKTLKY